MKLNPKHRGFDEIPNENKTEIPTTLEPIPSPELPEVKVGWLEKMFYYIKKTFGIGYETIQAINNFHSSIKWLAIVIGLGILAYIAFRIF